MKKLLLFLTLIANVSFLKAGHIAGSEISWTCDGNGLYTFEYIIYRDCSGASINGITDIRILGNPLPRNYQNVAIDRIPVRLDSSKFINNGDISPNCDTTTGFKVSCNLRNSIQRYVYKSDTIRLIGTPPATGWTFYQDIQPNSSYMLNLTRNTLAARSTLFQNGSQACLDNSPQFIEIPDFYFCRGTSYKLTDAAIDIDQDSLVYSFGIPLASINQVNASVPGYTFNSPLPDTSFNSLNIPLELNANSGEMKFRVNNGAGLLKYFVSRKLTAYRNGTKISETYREMPFFIQDCAISNDKPRISAPFYKGGSTFSFKDTINAGDFIAINLSVQDTNRINGIPQEIRVQVISDAIAKDYTFNGVCTNPRDTNCAYITSAAAVYNTQRDGYEIRRIGVYSGQIRWQTDCSDLDSLGGPRTHFFVIRAQDDLCPIPGLAYETVEVTVLPPTITPCPLITSVGKEKSIKDKLSIYPNPTNGLMNIESSLDGPLQVKVLNIHGQLVQEEVLLTKNNQIHLKGDRGIYFLLFTNENGQQANFKVVKQQ